MFNIKSAAVTYPPVREASREVANLTEKNLHTPAYGVKECLDQNIYKLSDSQ